jgi:hypothetical protein
MRRFLLILALSITPLAAEIIDRVAVSVGFEAITDSAIRRHLEFAAWLDEKDPDLSPESRGKAVDRLVEQFLLRREIGLSLFPMSTRVEASDRLNEIRQERGQTEAEFNASIARAGLQNEELLEEIRWQITLLRFMDFRFRPSIQISEDDLRHYYEGEFKAMLERQSPGASIPPLDDVRTQISAILLNQEVNRSLDAWLAQSRKQVHIRYHLEAQK